jgi:hypothetical protein
MNTSFSVTPGYESIGFFCKKFFELVLQEIDLCDGTEVQENQLMEKCVYCCGWNGVINRFEELEIVAILGRFPSFRLTDVSVKQLDHCDLSIFFLNGAMPPNHFEARYIVRRSATAYMHIQIEVEVDSPPVSGCTRPRW